MQLLLVLKEQKINHNDEPLSIDQLIEKVWAERIVADSSVYQAVAQLRKVLAEDKDTPIYIERISGKGYRIAIDVPIQAIEEEQRKSKQSYPILPLLLIVIFIILTILFMTKNMNDGQKEPFFEQLSLAEHLLKQPEVKQLEQAKLLYLEVLEKDSNNIEALHGLCEGYRLLAIYGTLSEIDRDNLCQPILEKAFKLAPDNPKVLASMAIQSLEKSNFVQAETLLEQSLAIDDKQAFVWHWYGTLKRNQNKVTGALEAHLQAFRLAPNEPIVLRGLAYAYLNNRDLENARKYYQRSLVITPKFKNKALYDLDFYPLNVSRAVSYLAWFRTYKEDHLKKYPSHKLSYIVFLLSVGQSEAAKQEFANMTEVQRNNAPMHFRLYVEAALAWHSGEVEKSLSLLSQRYHIAPEQNHFVMPYLMALLHSDKSVDALKLFNKHFVADMTENINSTNLGQYLLLAKLYQLNNDLTGYQTIYVKLLNYRQQYGEFSLHSELIWYDLIDKKDKRLELLTQLLNDGWLPDYNDNIFKQTYYLNLLTNLGQQKLWLKQLKQQQNCAWRERDSALCSTVIPIGTNN